MITPARPHRALAASLALLASPFALAAWKLEPPPLQPVPAAGTEVRTSDIRESTLPQPLELHAVERTETPPVARIVEEGAASPTPAVKTASPDHQARVAVGVITGRVRDANSGAPLGNVQVYLVGDEMGAVTRATGTFQMANVPAGIYAIRAERIGLSAETRTITVGEGTVEVEFRLNPQAIGLDEIVSNSRNPGPAVPIGSPSAPGRPGGPSRRPADTPVFTPSTVRPSVANLPAVWDAMEAAYTPALREAGVAGSVEVWIFVGANGEPQNVRINKVMPAAASFEPVLTRLAQDIAPMMRFSPAINRDERVAAWVALPLTFRP